MSAELAWSHGKRSVDVHPKQHHGTLRDFAGFCRQHRAEVKHADYICGALGGDGRRCRENTLPRNWLALDIDRIAAEAHTAWRLHLCGRYRGFGWRTHSATDEAPRERFVLLLDEPVDYVAGVRIGELLRADLAGEFGADVVLDPCGFRGSQPAFLPPPGVRLFYALGDALVTADWLAQAPPAPPPPPPLDELGADEAAARVAWVLRQFGEHGHLLAPMHNGQGYAVRCPWELAHTTPRLPADAVVLYPSELNRWAGAFRCLHGHCAGRGLGDVVRLLREVQQEATP